MSIDSFRSVPALGRHAPDHAQGAAFHVGLDLLVADLAAQLLLVIALQAGLADMGQRRVAFTELRQVGLVHAPDVADDVRQQRAIGVVAGQIRHHFHAREAPAVHRQRGDLLLAQLGLDGDAAKPAADLAHGQEALDLLRIQRHHLAQRIQPLVRIAGLVGHHVQAEGRDVLGQQHAVAVVDAAARRHDWAQLDAVGLRARGVLGVIEHLQLEVPRAQPGQADEHAQEAQRRAPAELVGLGMGILERAATRHGQGCPLRNAGPGAARRAARTPAATAPCRSAAPTSRPRAAAARRWPDGSRWRRCGR